MNIELLWENSIKNLKQTISSEVAYNLYLKDAVPVSFDGGVLTVSVPMSINKTMIDNRYKNQIETILSNILGNQAELNIVVNQIPAEFKATQNTTPAIQEMPQLRNSYDINPKYTFENFIIGASNEYATAAAIRAAENPEYSLQSTQKARFLCIPGQGNCRKPHLMECEFLRISDQQRSLRLGKFRHCKAAFLPEGSRKYRRSFPQIDSHFIGLQLLFYIRIALQNQLSLCKVKACRHTDRDFLLAERTHDQQLLLAVIPAVYIALAAHEEVILIFAVLYNL